MGFTISITSLVILLLVIALIIVIIKKHWYLQSVLAVVFLGSVACAIMGFKRLSDRIIGNDTTGAILVGMGLVMMLASAIVGYFIRKVGDGNNESAPAVNKQDH